MQAAATGRAAPPPREAWSTLSVLQTGANHLRSPAAGRAHRDGEAFVLQAELRVREGSLPAVQVGDLIRQVHLLEPRPLRRPQQGPVVT